VALKAQTLALLTLGMIGVAAVAAAQGRLVEGELESDLVPSPVPYAVLLPPGYDNLAPHPLLLWLHGGGGSRDFLAGQQALFEDVWARGLAPPMVVVTPSAGRSLYMDYRDGSQRWETFLLDELLAAMRANYRIDPDRVYVGGISMGGMGALRVAFKHPTRFRAVIALEPGIEPALAWRDVQPEDRFWRSDELFEERFGRPLDEDYWAANNPATIAHRDPGRLAASGLAIYIEVGSEDAFGLHRGTDFLHRVLFDAGVPHEYRYVLGADHVGRSVPPRIVDALAFLERIEAPAEPDPEVERVRRMLDGLKLRAGSAPGPHYAESVAIGAMSDDGGVEISLRLARFPARAAASVWLHVALGGEVWSLVDEAAAPTGPQVTAVDAATAEFSASGRSDVRFARTDRERVPMRGHVTARLLADATRHPQPGTGDVPVHVELEFVADDAGVRVNDGRRWELFGRVRGLVTTPSGEHAVDLRGKWHEQVGERPTFAPAFTYLNVQGERAGLLVIGYAAGTTGYAILEGSAVAVDAFEIDPPGVEPRRFAVALADGARIHGSARTVQTWSVPIEGRRRPGSGVVVESSLGTLVGSLNDWTPDEGAQ
jgi:S-formylglutathione hydrolase